MKFTKMHGAGNDYIYVNGFTEHVEDKSGVAIALSDRHFGIGSDGLIFINPSDTADFEMEMYNADGSRAEMCGNGIRCVAKYVYDKGLTNKKQFTIESMGAVKLIDLNVDEATGLAVSAKVNMGKPILSPGLVPTDTSAFADAREGMPVISRKLMVGGSEFEVTCVSMGNPHAVIFIDEPSADFQLEKWGPLFETDKAFPKRTNTEFAHIIDRSTIDMRVWERGAGETLACGTGACATAVAAVLNGLTDNTVTLKLLGGDLKIAWDGNEDSPVFMEGPAATVFEGEVEL